MKKFAILINSLKQGGAEKVVVLLNKYLSQHFIIKILLLEHKNFFNLKNNVCFLNNKIQNIRLINLFVNAYKLKKFVKQNNIDIVQSHLLRSNYINIISKLIGSKHQVQIVNHSLVNRFNNKLKGKIHIVLMKILYRFADVSISVSKEVEKQLLKYVKLPNKRYVIYNPIEYDLIRKLMKEEITDFEFQTNNKYLIMVGRINSIKKINIVIEALNELQDETIHLILIGEEEDIKVEDLINLSKYPDRIHYLGVKSNPYKYIYKSDLLIISSESESFGNVVVESMACETVVISSDCGGPREILCPYNCKAHSLKNGNIEFCEYGILYGINDKLGLNNAIDYIFQDNDLYQYYKDKGMKRAKEFDVSKIIKKYEKVLLNEKNNIKF